jgi:hypothetical protein
MKRAVVLPSLLVLAGACAKKNQAVPVPTGADYFPLTTGKYVIYEADSTVYGDIPRDTTVYRYQVKEVIADKFTDNEGSDAWRLERYYRFSDPDKPYDSLPWKIKEVWMVNINTTGVQVQEGNTRYTKLAFPVREFTRWNGNAFNQHGEKIYTYDYVHRPESINGHAADSVLKVKQHEERTLINHESEYEKYAAGIGLVERGYTSIKSNAIVPGVPVEKRIENGVIYRLTFVRFGYE